MRGVNLLEPVVQPFVQELGRQQTLPGNAAKMLGPYPVRCNKRCFE